MLESHVYRCLPQPCTVQSRGCKDRFYVLLLQGLPLSSLALFFHTAKARKGNPSTSRALVCEVSPSSIQAGGQDGPAPAPSPPASRQRLPHCLQQAQSAAAHRNSQRLSETRDVISKVCIQPLSRGTPRPCDTTCRKILADGNPHRFGNYAKRSCPITRRLPSRHLQVGADLVLEVGQALPSMAVAVKLHDSAKAPRQMK